MKKTFDFDFKAGEFIMKNGNPVVLSGIPEQVKPHIIAASTIRTVRLLTEKAKAILTTEHPALTRSIRGIIGRNQFVRIAVQ